MTDSIIKPKSPRFQDLTGMRFGRLTVIRFVGRAVGSFRWECLCDCGQKHNVKGNNLKNKHVQSCGCMRAEISSKRMKTHGGTVDNKGRNTPEYKSWAHMKARCNSETNHKYHLYGARGIKVCDRWLNNFENFLADMGQKPSPLHTIDRIDNNGNYEPSNCRWATKKEQGRNTRTNLLITHNGKTMTLIEWSELSGVNKITLRNRISLYGWSVEKALTKRDMRYNHD